MGFLRNVSSDVFALLVSLQRSLPFPAWLVWASALLFCCLPRHFPNFCFDDQTRAAGNDVKGIKRTKLRVQASQGGNERFSWRETERPIALSGTYSLIAVAQSAGLMG